MTRNPLTSGALALVTGLVALVANAGAPLAAGKLGFAPPDLDYAKSCIVRTAPVAPELDRDWTNWHGEEVSIDPNVMFAIASEYLKGSDRLPRSRETALAMLSYLASHQSVTQARIDRLLGKQQIADATDSAALREGEGLLLRAYNAGVIAAATDLAKLYGPSGPAELRDPAKARQYFRAAAASGDVDGQLAYARILAIDPSATAAERDLATSTALLSMIQRVGSGECRYMPTIADLYFRGELVPADIGLAIAWYEQYAETGDARTQEKLGSLLVSRFVAQADATRAMAYLEAAARQGRATAALTVGIAYASGSSLPQNPVAAEEFLTIAATGKVAEAEQWLARLYAGEFGGTPRPDLARQHFEAALANGTTPELESLYGQFLAQTGAPADRQRAMALLRHAADGGMGQAAVAVARLAMADSLNGGTSPTLADTYFRLGAALGKPEGARQMARIMSCGIGVQPSSDMASVWNDRALYLGSTTALMDAARAALASTDPALHDKGMILMRQAAYKGAPEAIGWLVARLETGRDGIATDEAMAAGLVRFIEQQSDESLRLAGRLEIIKARLAIATSDAERQTQMAALDNLVATGAPQAAQLKADILHDDPSANPAEILALYAKAATTGDKRAMRDYAQALDNNPATAAEARQWVEKAAAAGDLKSRISLISATQPDALARLDAIGNSGTACTADERLTLARAYAALSDPAAAEKARHWLEAAAQVTGANGNDIYKIADAYRDGVAGTDHVAEAQGWFDRAAKAGRTDALKDIANGHLLGLWTDSTPETAQSAIAALLASGDPGAADMMVRAVAAGQITASLDDIEKLLATAPHTNKTGDTYMKLVQLDETGTFGTPHADRQATWLETAANAGNTQAMMRLYRAYAAGIGVSASAETAASWLQKAAEGGDQRAAGELAAAYDVGFGVPIDPVKAAYWRDRAGQSS